MKTYLLTDPDGSTYESKQPGQLGGNSSSKIYGRLDCSMAINALPKGYAKRRVFFTDEEAGIAAGYRPCGSCMRERYKVWKRSGTLGSPGFPWKILPPSR